MKIFIMGNLLFISTIATFSQNLVNNDVNVSFNNPGGNYYSNVLSNGGGNNVIPVGGPNGIGNVQQQSIQARSNVQVNRGNTRQANNPVIIHDNVSSHVDVTSLEVNKTKVTVTKLPNISNGSVVHSNIKSHKIVSGSTTRKKVKNNFYTQTKTKVKHKRKPVFKKVKYHTSKCAVW